MAYALRYRTHAQMCKMEWFAEGSFFSEDPKVAARSKIKKDNEKLHTRERDPVNPMPRGFVPAYKNLHAEVVMVPGSL